MAEKSPKQYLVSFDSVSAQVGGSDISAIMELRLSAAANSVPTITLLVDVAGRAGASGTVADAVSLANAREAFDTFRSLVRTDGGTLSLSVTCRLDGPDGAVADTQKLSISGWLLTDVALSPIQREGVCTASLTFQHPLCKAHLGGAVPTLVAVPPLMNDVEDGNPFGVFVRALRMYEVVQRFAPLPASIPGAQPPAAIRDQLLSRLSKATSDLEAAVEWTHGGLPAFGYLSAWSSSLCRGLAQYASPSGGNSVLQALLGGLVPECSLALGGDFTQGKLELGPFEPWADSSLTISDSDIISMSFPQSDPSPISGVRFFTPSTGSDLGVTYMPAGCQMGEGAYPAEAFYVPDSELSATYLYGPIQQFSEPGWLVSMSEFEHNVSDTDAADATQDQSGGLVLATNTPRGSGVSFGSGSGAGDSIPSVEYASALMACAKAYFETSLMKDWAFTVESRLMFSTQGGVICPGRVLDVTAGSSPVLGGYVVGVEHVISVPSRSAVTRVTCTHPRFGSLPSAVTSSKNALYT